MNQIAFIFQNATLYWYSVVLALACAAGSCFFLACCSYRQLSFLQAAETLLLSLVLSLLFGRLLYWNCRVDTYDSLWKALSTPASGHFALAGAFLGCGAAAAIIGKLYGRIPDLLDCMSLGGCCAISLGRLANFFSAADRGKLVEELTNLPWSYPIMNSATGMPEYHMATFLFQSILTGVLFLVLLLLFFSPLTKKRKPGSFALLFLLVYSASQIILDSTRYDSLYLRINGFVSMVQILAAVGLAAALVLISLRAVKTSGMKKWYPLSWVTMASLMGCAGYMEYFVQRHGRLAFFAYSIMEHCLLGIVVLGILIWQKSAAE